ncbi:cytochrome P450 [Streptomyces sp. NPDC007851]|uniref:cytochrome P450 n=1 Tax=Streptomyces sp. NPDC007851 TaxID=3155008 RepID=UPI0033D765B9
MTSSSSAGPRSGGAARHGDALALLTAEFDGGSGVWRSARAGGVCVADPEAARAVLGNRHGVVADTSDFYHHRDGVFGPRSAQVAIGRAARLLIQRHLREHHADLPRLVAELAPRSEWPDAGNLLVLRHLRDVLLHPAAPPHLHATVEAIVSRAVRAGARERHSAPSRLLFRRRALAALETETRARQRAPRPPDHPAGPRDLLDVVVGGGGPAADPRELVEVYLSFLFATAGSVGFALGWAVHLVATHPGRAAAPPAWIVRETLRLWPVAWLFARTPSRAQELGGVRVTPRDRLMVCSYLVHRHPGHWERPAEFVPERWAGTVPDAAYLPFGHGPHTCAGATVTVRLLEDLVGLLTRDWRVSVTPPVPPDGAWPQVGPALAPPRFTATLSRPDSCAGRR